jgi:hypothetical protein
MSNGQRTPKSVAEQMIGVVSKNEPRRGGVLELSNLLEPCAESLEKFPRRCSYSRAIQNLLEKAEVFRNLVIEFSSFWSFSHLELCRET